MQLCMEEIIFVSARVKRKRTSQPEYWQEVEALVGEEYTVLSEYQNAFAHVKMRHNACGLEYSVAPAHFTSTGRRCPKCSRKR